MKGRLSTTTILLGCMGVIVVLITIGLILSTTINYIAEVVGPYILGAIVLVFFVIVGIYEWRQKTKQKQKDADFLNIAKGIRPNLKTEIISFFKSSKGDSRPIDLLYNFLDEQKQVITIDWKGEENEGEIEAFIESLNQEKIKWNKAIETRANQQKRKDSDDKFTIKLLKSIDKDIQNINARLLFLDNDGDSYVFTTVDAETHKKILGSLRKEFYGIDKL